MILRRAGATGPGATRGPARRRGPRARCGCDRRAVRRTHPVTGPGGDEASLSHVGASDRPGLAGLPPGGASGCVVVGQMLGVAVGMSLLNIALLMPIANHVSGGHQDLSGFADLQGNLALLALYLVLGWTLAAFVEELAFRGYLLTRTTDLLGDSRTGVVVALAFSAVLFATLHTEQGVVGAVIAGFDALVYGVLRHWQFDTRGADPGPWLRRHDRLRVVLPRRADLRALGSQPPRPPRPAGPTAHRAGRRGARGSAPSRVQTSARLPGTSAPTSARPSAAAPPAVTACTASAGVMPISRTASAMQSGIELV